MTIAATDCEILIPHFRRSAHYYLAGGIALIALGAGVFTAGKVLGWPDLANIGVGALGSTCLVPFRSYFKSSQSAGLLVSAKALLDRGVALTPMTESVLEHAIAGANE